MKFAVPLNRVQKSDHHRKSARGEDVSRRWRCLCLTEHINSIKRRTKVRPPLITLAADASFPFNKLLKLVLGYPFFVTPCVHQVSKIVQYIRTSLFSGSAKVL